MERGGRKQAAQSRNVGEVAGASKFQQALDSNNHSSCLIRSEISKLSDQLPPPTLALPHAAPLHQYVSPFGIRISRSGQTELKISSSPPHFSFSCFSLLLSVRRSRHGHPIQGSSCPPREQARQVDPPSHPAADPPGGLASVRALASASRYESTLIISPRDSSLGAAHTVLEGRKAVENILRGTDDRLVVVVGYVAPFITPPRGTCF